MHESIVIKIPTPAAAEQVSFLGFPAIGTAISAAVTCHW